ncbi:ABC transporter substrate-binding protein [Spirillospora sp. CA-294931]|uniref:ABC transporter substrate-binding protein n=1 Tax=Spirillospora sp. CA-294931 TaxID=3240042 RepID=UPI003D8C8B3C
MRLPRPRRVVATATAASLALAVLAACGGSDDKKVANPKGLEKPLLNVGVVPVPDSAPLVIAEQKGFFKEEGITIKRKVIKASPEATPLLSSGSMDLALLNYVSTFAAQDKGAIKFKLIADSYEGVNNSFALLTAKGSSIKDIRGLKGKKVGVPALKSITDLLLAINVKTNSMNPDKDLKITPIPLPNMATALKQGQVDAVAAVEPFVTNLQSQQGAQRISDLISGPTQKFPIAGWGGTEEFAQKNPKTVAAFQRAIGKALEVAAANRNEVTKVIPTYTQIPAQTASTITLGSFPRTLSTSRLERVAVLMKEYGYLTKDLDVKQLTVAEQK